MILLCVSTAVEEGNSFIILQGSITANISGINHRTFGMAGRNPTALISQGSIESLFANGNNSILKLFSHLLTHRHIYQCLCIRESLKCHCTCDQQSRPKFSQIERRDKI